MKTFIIKAPSHPLFAVIFIQKVYSSILWKLIVNTASGFLEFVYSSICKPVSKMLL